MSGQLKRNVEIRQNLAVGHERNYVVHVGIRIDVMQPHPHAECAERLREFAHTRLERPAVPESGAILDIDAVGTGVLRNNEQLLDARLHERLGFLHNLADRTAHQIPAQRRDDAKTATMIAALGDFQVGVMSRRQLDPRGWHEIHERIVPLRQMRVYRFHDLHHRVGPGNRQHLRAKTSPLAIRAGYENIG